MYKVLLCCLMFFACTKDDDKPKQETNADKIIGKVWKMYYFEQDGIEDPVVGALGDTWHFRPDGLMTNVTSSVSDPYMAATAKYTFVTDSKIEVQASITVPLNPYPYTIEVLLVSDTQFDFLIKSNHWPEIQKYKTFNER